MDEFMNEFISNFSQPDSNQIKYNEEQLTFIKSPLENSILLGIPGGGKTQCIIGKIIHHYKHNQIK